MSETDQSACWKWARNFRQAKKVREIGRTYVDRVRAAKDLSLAEKENKKKTKIAKSLKLLTKCKEWGGPVTEESLEQLTKLDQIQLLTEVRYLRTTIAPNIRERRKEGKRYIACNQEQLIDQIRNVLKPKADVAKDIESALSKIFVDFNEDIADQESKGHVVVKDKASQKSSPSPGTLGQFRGPLDEMKVGVVIAVGSENMIQTYESKRHGFVPSNLEPQPVFEWSLVEEITDNSYVTYPSYPNVVLLRF